MPGDEIEYDYVAGVSIGAINASVLATFPKGEEKEAIDLLTSLYETYTTSELFEFYSPWWIAPFTHPSFADNTKLMEIVDETLGDRPFQRKLSFMAADLKNGQVVIFDENMTNKERLNKIIASTSIPFAFPPQNIDDMSLVDGGMFSNVSLGDPIERCRQEVDRDEDIIVDMILCYESPWELDKWDEENVFWKNAYQFYERRHDLAKFYVVSEDVERMYRGYHKVDFRLVVQPSENLTQSGAIPISATLEDIEREIQLGIKDGIMAVKELNFKYSQ